MRIQTMAEVERAAIIRAIGECGGNVARAAYELRIGRATIYRKLKEHKIDPGLWRKRGAVDAIHNN